MVAKAEGGQRALNQLSVSWPVDSLVWASSVDGGPQIELPAGLPGEGIPGEVVEDDTHQAAAG